MPLTRVDMEDRESASSMPAIPPRALLDNNIVPVINENDAVATAEIKSAITTIFRAGGNPAGADKLLLLTDQPGLFTADPRNNPQAELIKDVYGIDDALRAIATAIAFPASAPAVWEPSCRPPMSPAVQVSTPLLPPATVRVIADVMESVSVGTPLPTRRNRRWRTANAGSSEPRRRVKLALMPAPPVRFWNAAAPAAKGIKTVTGNFSRGEVIRIRNSEGRDIAHGVSRYNSDALCLIAGQHSQQIDAILGYE